jgi:hypothetical protein
MVMRQYLRHIVISPSSIDAVVVAIEPYRHVAEHPLPYLKNVIQI